MADETEIATLVKEVKSDWHLFKKEHSKSLEAKADGKAFGELTEKVEKINKALDEKTAKLEAIETAIKRAPRGGREAERGAAEDKVMRKAFREWMAKGGEGRGDDVLANTFAKVFANDAALKAEYFETHPELKALSVGDDTAGGFQVHADLSGRIIKRVFETSPIRKLASIASITTDALEGIVDFDQPTASWVAEQGSRPQTNTPQFGVWRISTHELYAQPAATQKLLDDAAFDPEAWLADKVADKFARTENAAFVLGTGTGQPKGFLVENTITDAAGASATYDKYIQDKKIGYIPTGVADAFPAIPTTGGNPAQANPIVDLMYALKSQYRDMPGTAFATHRTSFGALRKLQDAFGQYIWQPGFSGQPATLFGYPIAEFNDMPVLSASSTNKFFLAFANWREAYQIVDRIGIRVLRDPYTAKPYVLFYTTKRVGGAVLNFEAIKLLKAATT
jgi:HK97 family phage major capsid protein